MPLTAESEPVTPGVDDEKVGHHDPPRTGHRRPKFRFLFAIIGVIGLIVWWSRPGPDTLLQRSKKLKIGNLEILGWASDRYLLACTPFNTGNPQGCLIDTVTGEQKPLDGLNAALSNAPAGVRARFPRNRVSPDGQWMLWGFTPARVPVIRHQFATRMDGSRTIEWVDKTPTWGYFSMWLPDSKHWIRARIKRRGRSSEEFVDVEEYSLQDPKSVKRYAISLPSFVVMGWRAPGILVATPDSIYSKSKQFGFNTIRYTGPAARMERQILPLPEESWMTEVRLTGDGNRLIVTTSRTETNMWLEMTSFIRTLSGWDAWLTYWVCSSDGSHYKEIGRVRSNLWGNGVSYDLIGPSPSGTKVAFWYRSFCYVAPVP